MKTNLRRVGNSKGVILPAILLAESGIESSIELTAEPGRIVITSATPLRKDWFNGYRAEEDEDVFKELAVTDADSGEWEW